MDKPTVDVLLATFNGERFLGEQLESLHRQKDVNVRVWANDDGSVDETLTILRKWQDKGLVKNISRTHAVGSTRAFLILLSKHSNSDFVAFCDQDDIWEPHKLITQIDGLNGDKPQMVFSRRIYIDEQNREIGISPKANRKISFRNALVENIAAGNTQLLNNAAIKTMIRFQNSKVQYYDSWTYLSISAFGECRYLDEPLVRYRIHGNNSVGLRRLEISRILKSVDSYYNQALNFKELLDLNGLDVERRDLEAFLRTIEYPSRLGRLLISLKHDFYRQRCLDNYFLVFLIMIRAYSRKHP